MVATTAKDMPRTLKEVRDCQAIISAKYAPALGQRGSQEEAGLPAWPQLKPLPQQR